ncbi:hypothetical protein FDENT_7182 [Fusarium denticulatum]|uniref:Uncharacterized protein n=1 Tax=Fusarium denticulatum TaxID=48507 RepID=A0A8H5X5W4_9HYPO|nr:hypothetical protein FDENT_7182 [Fusarium denticulatum]
MKDDDSTHQRVVTLLCHIAARFFVVSGGGTRPGSQVERSEGTPPIDIIREHELMTYLRTSVELGEGIQWNGSAYNVLMIVSRRPEGQSLSRGVAAREPITATLNRKGIPVAKRTAPFPYPMQKVEVPGKAMWEADWERDNSHWLNRLKDRHADPEVLLEHINAEVTQELVPFIKEEWRDKLYFFTKLNYSEFKIQLDVPRESQIVYHDTTRVERFYEETDPTRKVIHRIDGAVLNFKLSPKSCEETKRLVKEKTDTLLAYCDYEIGNYRRMLDSMSEHQYATAVTHSELQHSFLQNEIHREKEDYKRQAEKAKRMEALESNLAKAKQDLPIAHPQGYELRPKIADEEWSEYLTTECNIAVEVQKQWSKQLPTIKSAALAKSDPWSRAYGEHAPNFEIKGLLKLTNI